MINTMRYARGGNQITTTFRWSPKLMPLVVEREELEMLRKIEELGAAGKTQTEIAELLHVPLPTLRSRVLRLGFSLTPSTQLRTVIGEELLSDLLQRDEVVVRTPAQSEPIAA